MEYKIIEKVTPGGSDRVFYRCRVREKDTYILVWDKNLRAYLKLQKHLHDRGIAVPNIHWYDEKTNLLLIEDLGNDSLFTVANKRRKKAIFYHAAIDELVKLQIDGYQDAPINAYYDYQHIKWEQNYFKQHFLKALCGLKTKAIKELEDDFGALADELIAIAEPWTNFLMHRDYQSQNIYVRNKKVKIIDFQSARIGPLSYDIASLLRDSYVKIKPEEEKALINYYLKALKHRRIRITKKEFMPLYNLTALQRNMQALGAFANLSLNKEKTVFKKYIPRGLELLRTALKKSKFKKLHACLMDRAVSKACRS